MVLIMCSDPEKISKAYTPDSTWRNRHWFFHGTEEIVKFLTWKWSKEHNYKLRKELFAFQDNKIAVQFWVWTFRSSQTQSFEYYQDAHDDMKWKRCYGLEDWTFAEDGTMRKRQMSGNDLEISDNERWFKDGIDVNAVDVSEKHW